MEIEILGELEDFGDDFFFIFDFGDDLNLFEDLLVSLGIDILVFELIIEEILLGDGDVEVDDFDFFLEL